jgi:exodeoxyribonuclease VIII
MVLREKDADLVRRIADAVHNSAQAQEYLRLDGDAECPIQWDEVPPVVFGKGAPVRCKARLDWRCEPAVVDLKTVKDASPDAFGRAVHQYLWHVQGAWYQRGDAATSKGVLRPFIFIAVEKTPPFVVQVYELDGDAMEFGQAKVDEILTALVELRATWKSRRDWPGYSTVKLQLQLPPWAWGPGGEASIEMLEDEDDGQGQELGQEEEQ